MHDIRLGAEGTKMSGWELDEQIDDRGTGGRRSGSRVFATVGLVIIATIPFLAGFSLFRDPEVKVDAYATGLALFAAAIGTAAMVALLAVIVAVARATDSNGIVRGLLPSLLRALAIIAVVSFSATAGIAMGSELDASRTELGILGQTIFILVLASSIWAAVGYVIGLMIGAIKHHVRSWQRG